jgi:hypothetical protein
VYNSTNQVVDHNKVMRIYSGKLLKIVIVNCYATCRVYNIYWARVGITGFLSTFIFICKYMYINRWIYLQNSMKSYNHVTPNKKIGAKKCNLVLQTFFFNIFPVVFEFLNWMYKVGRDCLVSGEDPMIRISNKSPMLLENTSVLLSIFSSVLTEVTETTCMLASKI